MKRMLGSGAGSVVARSLRISAATHAGVAAVAAAVALNAIVAMQFLQTAGQAVILAAVFALLCVGLSATAMDLYSRSKQTLSNLRSIGASRGRISPSGTVMACGATLAAVAEATEDSGP